MNKDSTSKIHMTMESAEVVSVPLQSMLCLDMTALYNTTYEHTVYKNRKEHHK